MFETMVNSSSGTINIGSVGENGVRCLLFDVSEWIQAVGEGTAALATIRSGDKVAFPVPVSRSGNIIRWVISAADVANDGYGKAQLDWIVGDRIAKSAIYRTYTKKSLTASGPAPEPGQNYLNEIVKASKQATDAAEYIKTQSESGAYDGGYYTVTATVNGNELTLTFTGSKEGMEAVPPQTITLPSGGEVGPEAIARAVEAYFQQNPIKYPVTSVNEKTGAVTITAADLGALTQEALQGAISEALREAKESGEFDGKDATVDPTLSIPGQAADAEETGKRLNTKIPWPTVAKVGQVFAVKAVDDQGRPIDVEAVDTLRPRTPRKIAKFTANGISTKFEVTLADYPELSSIRNIFVTIRKPQTAPKMSNIRFYLNGKVIYNEFWFSTQGLLFNLNAMDGFWLPESANVSDAETMNAAYNSVFIHKGVINIYGGIGVLPIQRIESFMIHTMDGVFPEDTDIMIGGC